MCACAPLGLAAPRGWVRALRRRLTRNAGRPSAAAGGQHRARRHRSCAGWCCPLSASAAAARVVAAASASTARSSRSRAVLLPERLRVDDRDGPAQVEAGGHRVPLDDDVEVQRLAVGGGLEREDRLADLRRPPARDGDDAQLKLLEREVLLLREHRPDDDVRRRLAVRVEGGRVVRRLRHQLVQHQHVRVDRQLRRQVLQLRARDGQRHALPLRGARGALRR